MNVSRCTKTTDIVRGELSAACTYPHKCASMARANGRAHHKKGEAAAVPPKIPKTEDIWDLLSLMKSSKVCAQYSQCLTVRDAFRVAQTSSLYNKWLTCEEEASADESSNSEDADSEPRCVTSFYVSIRTRLW